ncbi:MULTISPECIES: histidine--tRNA ligase [Virgibacillus]|uniref:Histidine--tRNA ligase n=2 Tax=Virgibacillus TaxID=84406 RepID=A0A024QB72_9BACI|nr:MULTISPECIES: histidine--tRNA ligase [Virgibacillus]EQB35860.1 histidyl-tRNA synthetase [Virgibacillus sp. CM-4]MYL41662.1 histidine--tRNA ligase [Virgibacillus massiliensis]GGJ49111.1 histidine--tRNA ligase [Virgibacillus kapii]CDQ39472.1 Histidine--tRNA ligase [Virgibacillus massiliensis]
MSYKAPRGTADILPQDANKWQFVEAKIKEICNRYHFHEIRTPLFEHTEVFQRGVGDSTDIVQKEMYTFEDRGGRSITLRPEGTASVVRSFVENKLYGSVNQPVKLYYFAQMFRYERPQKGRMRQLNQFGVEVLGSADPAVDAEVIDLAMTCYREMGLTSLKLVINSLGDKESRENHRQALIDHFTPHKNELCGDCQMRLEKNPLRILDCKKDREHPAMKTAPSILDYLNDESQCYFEKVKEYLTLMGIEYHVDKNLVRGLDYYNHTAFEIMSEADGFGAITTLAGGGRYNGLVEELGGPNAPGIGFGMGLERLLMALEAEQREIPVDSSLDCYCIAVGEQAEKEAVRLVHNLRNHGIQVDKDYQSKKMKGQFKAADRYEAKYVLILGEDELNQQHIAVREMKTGNQENIPLSEVVDVMKAKLLGGNQL